MNNKKVSLILEGGGARCSFTAGVLDYFIEKQLEFPLTIAASSSAFVGINYINSQFKRILSTVLNKSYLDIKKDKHAHADTIDMFAYLNNLDNLLTEYDFEGFLESNKTLLISTTDLITGENIFFNANKSNNYTELLKLIAAASSHPDVAKPVSINYFKYYSGSCSSRIPILESLKRGYNKSVVVLTRPIDHIMESVDYNSETLDMLDKYKSFLHTAYNTHKNYNDTKTYLQYMESHKDVVVICPKKEAIQHEFDFNYSRILIQYNEGYSAAKAAYIDIQNLTNKKENWYG